MVAHNVLLIEDDPELRGLLDMVIEGATGRAPVHAAFGNGMIRQVGDAKPELILVNAKWINGRQRLAMIGGIRTDPSTRGVSVRLYHAPTPSRSALHKFWAN